MTGNYRGIALSSMLSKLVNIIIIKKQSKHLNSSDLQFGFKENSSTTIHLWLKKSSITTVGMEKQCMLHFWMHLRHLTVL